MIFGDLGLGEMVPLSGERFPGVAGGVTGLVRPLLKKLRREDLDFLFCRVSGAGGGWVDRGAIVRKSS